MQKKIFASGEFASLDALVLKKSDYNLTEVGEKECVIKLLFFLLI